MVKSLLEDAGIEAFVLGHAKATYNPGWNLPGEEGSVRVMISELELEGARPIVEEYLKNLLKNVSHVIDALNDLFHRI